MYEVLCVVLFVVLYVALCLASAAHHIFCGVRHNLKNEYKCVKSRHP